MPVAVLQVLSVTHLPRRRHLFLYVHLQRFFNFHSYKLFNHLYSTVEVYFIGNTLVSIKMVQVLHKKKLRRANQKKALRPVSLTPGSKVIVETVSTMSVADVVWQVIFSLFKLYKYT